jgi:hypothetical protein
MALFATRCGGSAPALNLPERGTAINPSAFSKEALHDFGSIADGAAAVGAAIAGLGIYGGLLHDLPFKWAAGAVGFGLLVLGGSLYAGGRLGNERKDERDR